MDNVAVVIVTYNRLDFLKKVLDSYAMMSPKPQKIIVVDNASASDTVDYLKSWRAIEGDFEKIVVRLSSNRGGAGGFEAGMKEALERGCDWVFVADDDAFPAKDLFRVFDGAYRSIRAEYPDETIAALCSSVYEGGEIATIHRKTLRRGSLFIHMSRIDKRNYDAPFFPCDLFTYVGTMIRADALRQVGIADGGFFISWDDHEHAIRVGKYGKTYCVPKAVMVHKNDPEPVRVVGWRDYYFIRNQLIMVKEHFGARYFFTRAVYSTTRQVVRNLIRCHDLSLPTFRLLKRAVSDASHGVRGLSDAYLPGNPIR